MPITVMTERPARYDRGKHPKSLENLKHSPRTGGPPLYDENKERAGYTITPTAKSVFEKLAAKYELRSVSEAVEQVARGIIHVEDIED